MAVWGHGDLGRCLMGMQHAAPEPGLGPHFFRLHWAEEAENPYGDSSWILSFGMECFPLSW